MNVRRHSARHSLTTLSEINVTPLIDLAFVLLIIFIITTPFLQTTLDLILPTTTAAPEAVTEEGIQIISIDRLQQIELNESPVTLEQLPTALRALREAAGDQEIAVIVRPHRELPVQNLVRIMSAVRDAGITKVGVTAQIE